MDEQISPLEKMFPTRAIRWGMLALLGTPVAANSLGELIPPQVLIALTTQLQIAKIAIFLALVCLIGGLIILDYALLLNVNNKHSRIIHHSNLHPNMSAKWLFDNATWRHYLFITTLVIISFSLGFYAAQP